MTGLAGSAPPATLYHKGTVLTMAGDEPSIAEALIGKNGQIVFVGKLSEARERKAADTLDFDPGDE